MSWFTNKEGKVNGKIFAGVFGEISCMIAMFTGHYLNISDNLIIVMASIFAGLLGLEIGKEMFNNKKK